MYEGQRVWDSVTVFRFGRFELDVPQRRLSKDEVPVRLGARAFDLLAYLLENAGTVVSKNDLMKAAWPATTVDDVSLRVHLVGLRKILHDGVSPLCIENIAGRGYQFVKPVTKVGEASVPQLARQREVVPGLPATSSKLLGRDRFVVESADLLRQSRVMTIVGPGGIGKTSAAVEVARALSGEYEEVHFLDLATLSDGSLIASYIASKLGIGVYSDDPLPGIIQTIGENKSMLIFDNCEHIVDACADVVQQLVDGCPELSILSTSREPLRIASERVRQLSALAVPGEGEIAATPFQFAAVELFIERTSLVSDDYRFDHPAELQIASTIVRRLDGIPLAIELAASRVADLGLEALASSLVDPIKVLRRGRRTAPPRQQTLRATLDWSYQWLSEGERNLLLQLSVFAGRFTEDAALQVATKAIGEQEFFEALDGLTSKSLVSVFRADSHFRLLETTREYASTKLAESDDARGPRLAHALYVRDKLRKAQLDWESMQTAAWMGSYGEIISDIRSALSFCFRDGDASVGVEISATSGIVWTQLGLMSEHLKVVERALVQIVGTESASQAIESQLRSTYAAILFHVKSGTADDQVIHEFRKAAVLAEQAKDQTLTLRAHSGVTAMLTVHGKYHEATDIALNLERMFGVISNAASSRIICHNAHYLGKHDLTRRMAKLALDGVAGSNRTSSTSGASYDQKTTALMLLAKTAWIEGAANTAEAYLEEAVTEALILDQATSTCMLLATSAFPVYSGLGKQEAASSHLALLHEISTKHSLSRWKNWASGYDLVASPDNPVDTDAIGRHFAGTTIGPQLENMCVLAGIQVDERLLDFALSGHAGWCRAELYRIKGELSLAAGDHKARQWMVQGRELAIEQGAVLWELRCAVSLAHCDQAEERDFDGDALDTVIGKFREPLSLRERLAVDRLTAR